MRGIVELPHAASVAFVGLAAWRGVGGVGGCCDLLAVLEVAGYEHSAAVPAQHHRTADLGVAVVVLALDLVGNLELGHGAQERDRLAALEDERVVGAALPQLLPRDAEAAKGVHRDADALLVVERRPEVVGHVVCSGRGEYVVDIGQQAYLRNGIFRPVGQHHYLERNGVVGAALGKVGLLEGGLHGVGRVCLIVVLRACYAGYILQQIALGREEQELHVVGRDTVLDVQRSLLAYGAQARARVVRDDVEPHRHGLGAAGRIVGQIVVVDAPGRGRREQRQSGEAHRARQSCGGYVDESLHDTALRGVIFRSPDAVLHTTS